MKRIGVLGGMSPQVTTDLESRVHHVSQRIVPQEWNAGYPPMVAAREANSRGATEKEKCPGLGHNCGVADFSNEERHGVGPVMKAKAGRLTAAVYLA